MKSSSNWNDIHCAKRSGVRAACRRFRLQSLALALGASLASGAIDAVAKTASDKPKVDKEAQEIKKVKPPKPKGRAPGGVAPAPLVPSAPPTRPPAKALDPSPANEAVGINVAGGLQWRAAEGAESYDVYFGPNDPPPPRGAVSGTSFETGELKPGTEYYWRVDAKNALGTTRGAVWRFATRRQGDPYDPRNEHCALGDSPPVNQKQQVWGETQPPLRGVQRVRFGPDDAVSYDFDGCNMNMPYHIGGRHAQALGRLNGAFDVDMGYLCGDESGIWSRPYKMLEGVRIEIEEQGQPAWTLDDCRETVNRFSHLKFHFERDGLKVVRRDLPSDTDCAMFFLVNIENAGRVPRAFVLRFTFEENVRPGWVPQFDIRMGPDTIQQHGGRFAAFDGYQGGVAIAFGGTPAPDRTSIDSSNPYNNQARLEYDLTLKPGQTADLEFLCAQYDSMKHGPVDSPVQAALTAFDRLKGSGRRQLEDKYAAWERDLYRDSTQFHCPDAMLVNGFYGAKFGLRTMRVDVRNYYPYPCQFVCDTNYMSLFAIDNLYSFSGGVAAGLRQVAADTLRDINHFGQTHPNSLIYKNVCADPRNLPPTGDARVQGSAMFVAQVWDYARWTGDRAFVEEMYGPCAGYTRLTEAKDTNGDLFPEGMCQPNAGKEPDDQNVDGACYLWAALDAMSHMAAVLGKTSEADDYRRRADALKAAINKAFWNEEHGVFAEWIKTDHSQHLLFDPAEGRSHPSVLAPLRLGVAEWDKGRRCLKTLNRHCVDATGFHGPATTAWSSGMMARGAYRYGLPKVGANLIGICARLAYEDDMFIPSYSNVMGGTPDAARKINYTWSCGPPLEAIVRGMFGIEPDAFENRVTFAPQVPPEWEACSLDNVQIGHRRLRFEYRAPRWTVTHEAGTKPITVAFRAGPNESPREEKTLPAGASVEFRGRE